MSYKNITGVSKKNNTQGVSEINEVNTQSELHYENIVKNGFSIVKNVFAKKDCRIAKVKIDEIYKEQIKEYGDNEKSLAIINENNLVRLPIVYDKFFLKFITNQKINNVLKIAFGEKYILNLQNCPINRAHDKHFGSVWHRDLSYQHFIPSRPIAISALVCVDEFTKENGGTCIIPFSHKFEKFPSKNFSSENEKKIEANIGDVFMFDSLLFHRAGENNTNEDRKLIVQVFTLPFVKQQISLPKALSGKFSDNQELSYVLGYETEVEESVLEWRKRRKRRYQQIKK